MTLRTVLRLPRLLAASVVEVARDSLLRQRLLERHQGLHLGRGVEIRSADRLRIGRNVVIDSRVLLHCGGMSWSRSEGYIVIGDDCYIGPGAVLFGAGGIELGSHVGIGPGVVIASHQNIFSSRAVPILDQPLRFAPVVIEDNVMITSNATILPGVRVRSGSVIGAGAVLTRDAEPHSLYLGVPARRVREL